ncbi:MAG: Ohr family peroxiredoxin [Bacteroidales bacterium]|nr:Ohr family peroxiredoxin [Bacteroidales bacterium]
MERLYTAKATCVGGRSGTVKTDDGVLSLTMCMPDEHSKFKSEKCTNPEQLFACAYSVCFLSALNYILKKERLPYEDTKVDIYVHLNDQDKRHYLSVDMDIYMPKIEMAKAKKILHLADEICPYSKAIRNNVEVGFNIHVD